MPRITVSDREMEKLKDSGIAEILFRPAAEEEFGLVFGHTKPNQLVAKVTVTKYYRHSNWGYEEIPSEDLKEVVS